jgi:hypothetical protein
MPDRGKVRNLHLRAISVACIKADSPGAETSLVCLMDPLERADRHRRRKLPILYKAHDFKPMHFLS